MKKNLYSVTLATGVRDDQVRVEPITAVNIFAAIIAARNFISRPHAALIRWERFSAHTAARTLARHPEQIIQA